VWFYFLLLLLLCVVFLSVFRSLSPVYGLPSLLNKREFDRLCPDPLLWIGLSLRFWPKFCPGKGIQVLRLLFCICFPSTLVLGSFEAVGEVEVCISAANPSPFLSENPYRKGGEEKCGGRFSVFH